MVYHQGSIAFRWYKHAGRAVESTRPTDDAELELIVGKCIDWMARMDGADI